MAFKEPKAWQKWLSPRPKVRLNISKETKMWIPGNMAVFEFLRDDANDRWVVRETHFHSHPDVRAGKSGPPLHIHLLQDEIFEIKSGVLAAVINGKHVTADKNSGPVVIPKGARHKFWMHESSTEDLIFHFVAEPQGIPRTFDGNVLRNRQGFNYDCEREGIKPSVFQAALSTYEGSTLFCPPFWTPMWLLKGVNYFAAHVIGRMLLGYSAMYPEYSSDEGFGDSISKYED